MSRKQNIIARAIKANIIDDNLTVVGIMDLDRLQKTVADAYAAFPENFFHTFAVKANALVNVLKPLREYGMGAEVASPGEFMIAQTAGVETKDIMFDSQAKPISDLRTCIKHNIHLNINNSQ